MSSTDVGNLSGGMRGRRQSGLPVQRPGGDVGTVQ